MGQVASGEAIDAILAEEGEIAESRREDKRERERMKVDSSKGKRRERSRSPPPDITCNNCGRRGHVKKISVGIW